MANICMKGFSFSLLYADQIIRSSVVPLATNKVGSEGLTQLFKRVNGARLKTGVSVLRHPFESRGECMIKDFI